MAFWRRERSEPPETVPTEAELAATRDRIIEHVAALDPEDLQLELANYDSDRLAELAATVAQHAEDPELAARVAEATGGPNGVIKIVKQRDTEWAIRFANALPEERGHAAYYAEMIIKSKVEELEPNSASVPQVEGLIDAMPVDADKLRREYVTTIASWQAVRPETILAFTKAIGYRPKRDQAVSAATRVFTSKNPDVTVADVTTLTGDIKDRELADQAWVSAAKHLATHRRIGSAELHRFIAEGRTAEVRTEAVEKAAIRCFFSNQLEYLQELFDCFSPAERPKLREKAAQAIYASEENQTNPGYRDTKRHHGQPWISALLTPKTELAGLIDAVRVKA